MRLFWILLALAVATGCASATPRPPLFEMHSGFWLNLHLRLHYAATGRRPAPPAAPPAPDAPAWRAAVEYYRTRFGERGGMALFFDDELIGIQRRLARLEPDAPPTGVDAELAGHLGAAAALVRDGWAREDARNRAWVEALEPRLTEHGKGIAAELAAIYGTPWPSRPLRVDVSCFGGPVGAYTVDGPPHIVISSCHPGYQGDAALEMIFHEASHVLVGRVEQAIEAAAKRRGRPAPPDLWHALIFYTAGQAVRRRVAGYVPYATHNHLAVVRELEPSLRRHWQPYLDGALTFDQAVERLVR